MSVDRTRELVLALRGCLFNGDWGPVEAAMSDAVALEHPAGRIEGAPAVIAFLRDRRFPPLREVLLLGVAYADHVAYQSYYVVPSDVGRFVLVIDELSIDDAGKLAHIRSAYDRQALTGA